MRRSIVVLALAAALLPAALAAQAPPRVRVPAATSPRPDTAAVRRVVRDYVEGFYEGDTAKLVRALHPSFAKYGFSRPARAAAYQGMAMSWAQAMSYARDVKSGGRPTPASAPKEITLLDVLDQTASAKLRATWGTDYLLLARFEGGWKITHVLWQSPAATAAR